MSSSSPLLLAIDTSTRAISLALYDGYAVICEHTWLSNDYHTVELAPAIADLFSKTNYDISDLSAISVATGPGSFTGMRIGIALAKGLAFALSIPLVGISTLDILAAAQTVQRQLLVVVLRAGRNRLVAGRYKQVQNKWKLACPIEAVTIEQLNQRINTSTFVCGELKAEEIVFLSRENPKITIATPAQCLRRASYLAELGWEKWRNGHTDDPAVLSPFYLHYNESI